MVLYRGWKMKGVSVDVLNGELDSMVTYRWNCLRGVRGLVVCEYLIDVNVELCVMVRR